MKISKSDYVELLRKVFFLAMKAGYASDGAKLRVKELPGSRLFTFEYEDSGQKFTVSDLYFVTPNSLMSFGTTIIACQSYPSWYMQYHGEYDNVAVPLLKQALRKTYEAEAFLGGRGLQIHLPVGDLAYEPDQRDLVYTNSIEENDFCNFSGREEIRNLNTLKSYGWHRYTGSLMISDSWFDV